MCNVQCAMCNVQCAMCNVGRPVETASIIHVLSRVGGLKLETVFFLAIILAADFI